MASFECMFLTIGKGLSWSLAMFAGEETPEMERSSCAPWISGGFIRTNL